MSDASPYKKVFISYRSTDRHRVDGLRVLLSALGHEIFIDYLSLRGGRPWQPALIEGMGRSAVLVLFWTQAASDSDEIWKEFQYFLKNHSDRPLVVVRGDRTPVPDELSTLHHANFCPILNELLDHQRTLREAGVSKREIQRTVLRKLREAGIELDARDQKKLLLLFGSTGFTSGAVTAAIVLERFLRAGTEAVVGLSLAQALVVGLAALIGVALCRSIESASRINPDATEIEALVTTLPDSTVRQPVRHDRRLVFAIDHSPSMDDNDPSGLRFRFVRDLLERLRGEKIDVSVLYWGGRLERDRSITLTSDLAAVVGELDRRLAAGETQSGYISGTNPNKAISGMLKDLDASPHGLGILLTDGDSTISASTGKSARASGYVIHTIGLSVADREENLRSIAELTGGDYFHAPEDVFLEEILQTFSSAVTAGRTVDLVESRPAAIRLALDRRSQVEQQSIEVTAHLVNRDGVVVRAVDDVAVQLRAQGATLDPEQMTITAGATSARAALTVQAPGPVVVRSRTALRRPEASARAEGCATGKPAALRLDARRARAPIGGRIDITLVAVDTDGKAVAVGAEHRSSLSLDPGGQVVRHPPNMITANECAWDTTVTASGGGWVTLTAYLEASPAAGESPPITVSRQVLFYRPLGISLLMLAALGGAAGALLCLFRDFVRRREWVQSSLLFLLCAAASLACVLAASTHFGGVILLGLLPSILPLAAPLGVVAGYGSTRLLNQTA